MNIDFILSHADSSPMYQQVMARINERIAVGDWPAGTKLPSIRELAVALKVSVITIKRAYQELEHEGVIFVQHGKGCFVADQSVDQRARQEEDLEQHLTQVVRLADAMQLEDGELETRLKKAQDKIREGN
jgi:GntR family transcriptional regulator